MTIFPGIPGSNHPRSGHRPSLDAGLLTKAKGRWSGDLAQRDRALPNQCSRCPQVSRPRADRARRAAVFGIVALLMLISMACAETVTVTPGSYAVQRPPVTSTMLQPTVEQAEVNAYLAGLDSELKAMAWYKLATATAQVAQATSTQRAADATATADIAHATATARAWQTTVEAAQVQATATAGAQAAIATATAQAAIDQATATAIVEARQATVTALAVQTTATAEAVIFQQRATATGAAWAFQATGTAETARTMATVQAASAAKAYMAAERERITHPVRAYGPWILLGIFGMVTVVGVFRLFRVAEIRARVVKMGPHEREIVLLNGKVLQPTRGHLPILDYDQPERTQPEAVSDKEQRDTTARAQTVELMRAAHPPTSDGEGIGRGRQPQAAKPKMTARQAQQLMARHIAQRHPETYGEVRVVPAHQVRAWLDDVRPQAYRDALTHDLET